VGISHVEQKNNAKEALFSDLGDSQVEQKNNARNSFERFRAQIEESDEVRCVNPLAVGLHNGACSTLANTAGLVSVQSSECSIDLATRGVSEEAEDVASFKSDVEDFGINCNTHQVLQDGLILCFERADASRRGVLQRHVVSVPSQEFFIGLMTLVVQYDQVVWEQLDGSGLGIPENLKLLLVPVAVEQDDGNIVYRDAVVEAGLNLLQTLKLI
jgi:hypothetical protein